MIGCTLFFLSHDHDHNLRHMLFHWNMFSHQFSFLSFVLSSSAPHYPFLFLFIYLLSLLCLSTFLSFLSPPPDSTRCSKREKSWFTRKRKRERRQLLLQRLSELWVRQTNSVRRGGIGRFFFSFTREVTRDRTRKKERKKERKPPTALETYQFIGMFSWTPGPWVVNDGKRMFWQKRVRFSLLLLPPLLFMPTRVLKKEEALKPCQASEFGSRND